MTSQHSAAESAHPRDSIDRHIDRWGREVTGLVPELEGAVTRMQMLVRHLQQKKEAALARHGLKLWEYEILWRLRSAGKPYRMSPTHLARGLGVHPATLTNRLDRLQSADLVTREHAPEDRRSLLVGLTPRGAEAWAAVIDDQREAEATLFAHLAKEELEHLSALLRVVVLAVEENGPPLMPHHD
ncbi:MarR family winged helix-turn-helix transcriptional regulator [Streptomyces sp. NBC_00316]|uniref:MarR family winged helix-turn-helix transcriptional regulator n=1 Tax=Streptomyces sp. NBC_00316 TaxID=2975710 RepID=UPI002E29293E|nr:MarR family transcriptional regulator [Streptomyces sp. NBC_00316]